MPSSLNRALVMMSGKTLEKKQIRGSVIPFPMKNSNRDAEAIWSEMATSADEVAEPGLKEQDQVDVSKARQIVPRYRERCPRAVPEGFRESTCRPETLSGFAISGYDSARFAYIT